MPRGHGVSLLSGTAIVVLALSLGQPKAMESAGPTRIGRITGPSGQARPYSDTSYGLTASYYSARDGFTTTLVLNNKGTRDLNPRIVLYSRAGKRFTSSEVFVPKRSFIEADLSRLVRDAGDDFQDGSLKVQYTGMPMELGGLVKIENLSKSIAFSEMLAYPSAAKSSRLEAVWQAPNASTDIKVVITNVTAVECSVALSMTGQPQRTVTIGPWQLYVFDVRATAAYSLRGSISLNHQCAPGAIVARGFQGAALIGYSSNIAFTDPATRKTSTYHAGGLRTGSTTLQNSDARGFRLSIVASNVSDATSTVTGRIRGWNAAGSPVVIELQPASIERHAVAEISTSQEWEALLRFDPVVSSLELEYSTTPGSVFIAAETVSQNGRQSFSVPLVDPASEPSPSGSYYMHARGNRQSVAYINNTSDLPVKVRVVIRHANGFWAPAVITIRPHAVLSYDLGAIRDFRLKDGFGNTIPETVDDAQLHWSALGGDSHARLIGHVEQDDLDAGVSSVSACPLPASDIFCEAWLDPDEFDTVYSGFDEWITYSAWEQDADALNGSCNVPEDPPYEISGELYWTSYNEDVLVNGGGGWFHSIGEGYVGVRAQGESLGWDQYDPEGPGGNHISLNFSTGVQAQSCGDATRSAIRAEYPKYNVTLRPACDDFTDNSPTVYFTFGEIMLRNQFTIGLLRQPFVEIYSVGWGLDQWRNLYGDPMTITSGYRNPRRNFTQIPQGAANSRHMYGDAADVATGSDHQVYLDMAAAATLANADYIEPVEGPCGWACVHADWRNHAGGFWRN